MTRIFYTLFLTTLIAGFFSLNTVSAAGLNETYCNLTPTAGNDVSPDLPQLVCPFIRVYNFAILASGVVLVGMIAVGGIRLSMSLGDPKGYESATRTFTYTLWGIAIVLGSFLILRLVFAALGLNLGIPTPLSLFSQIACALEGWQRMAFITPSNPVCP